MTLIALIDDHELLRSGLATIINSFEGYKVIMEASNGKQFIDTIFGFDKEKGFGSFRF